MDFDLVSYLVYVSRDIRAIHASAKSCKKWSNIFSIQIPARGRIVDQTS
jgi:hypothetical protein